MAQKYMSGAVDLFVGSGSQVFHLGTCEKKPKISLRPSFRPVFNDLGGQDIEMDTSYQGKAALVTAELTRFDHSVLERIYDRGVVVGGSGYDGGFDNQVGIGSLMVSEGLSHVLYLKFTAAGVGGKNLNLTGSTMGVGGPLPAGYRFPAAVLIGPDDLDPGTDALRVMLTWKAYRFYDPTAKRFTLYDNNLSGVPAAG